MAGALRLLLAVVLLLSFVSMAVAGKKKHFSSSSVLVEAEGQACLGQDRIKTQARRMVLDEAKRAASEKVSTHVLRETKVIKGMSRAEGIPAALATPLQQS
ncbi:hypothetical protein D0S45_19200 [Marinifilum sp. JC120]|nr:hypothetical protein D0S45_19200 [Marinifilum sp. JC120]